MSEAMGLGILVGVWAACAMLAVILFRLPGEIGGRPAPTEEIRSLRCADGDYLVLTVPGSVNVEMAARLRHHFEAGMPGKKVLVLGDGMKISAVLSTASDIWRSSQSSPPGAPAAT